MPFPKCHSGGKNASIMHNQPKTYIDYHCEILEFVKDHVDGVFHNFGNQPVQPGAVYVLGRMQMKEHIDKVRSVINEGKATIVFSNPAEASETFYGQISYVGARDLVTAQKLPIITGSSIDPDWINLDYDSFVHGVLRFDENVAASQQIDEIYRHTDKPYKFLFLNGRLRAHRKWMLERMRMCGLLEQSLYTCLEQRAAPNGGIQIFDSQGQDLMFNVEPIKYLPAQYEYPSYQTNIGKHNVEHDGTYAKYKLFDNEWGEVYIHPKPYIDTYFSLVTETVFNTPYSFRTEKIWKAILMGHPWICVSNSGFYRDMKNLGFKTFDSLIDESFDTIDHRRDRLEKIAQTVEDLCSSDLASFLRAAESICKYNQQHMFEYRDRVVSELPDRFLSFIRSVAK